MRLRLLLHALALALVLLSVCPAAAETELAWVREVIVERAQAHGVSAWTMLAVARCESPGLSPYAVGDSGTSLGLYQLNRSGLLPVFYGLGYTDVWDAWQQADFAARMFASGQARHWSCWWVAVLGLSPPWWR